MQIQQYINTLPFRGDCLRCGNKNTLSASVVDGFVLYNCYHTSCKLRGKFKHEHSMEDLRTGNYFPSRNSFRLASKEISDQEYIVPSHFTSPLQNPQCFSFMKRWRLLDAYAKGIVSIWYDARQNRCVFGIKDHEGNLKGASGRLLAFCKDNPRWFVYGRIDGCPGIISHCNANISTAILVEDFVSAVNCNISSGVALLGTSIPGDCVRYLVKYKKLYIALDPDAASKAIKLQHQLAPYVDTKILTIKYDLKYYTPLELKELRKEIENEKSSYN